MAQSEAALVIYCDSRESRSGIAQILATFPGVTLKQIELSCGDYLVQDRVVVERKTATDFVLSIMDDRLFEQAAKMAVLGTSAVLLLEGDPLTETPSDIEPDAIVGALSALPVFFGVSILQSSSAHSSATLIYTMARHAVQGLSYDIPLRAKKKPKAGSLASVFLAEGLPSVGPVTARRLLQHFGTARALFGADEKALRQVTGVGPKGAASIVAALDAPLGHVFSTKGPPQR